MGKIYKSILQSKVKWRFSTVQRKVSWILISFFYYYYYLRDTDWQTSGHRRTRFYLRSKTPHIKFRISVRSAGRNLGTETSEIVKLSEVEIKASLAKLQSQSPSSHCPPAGVQKRRKHVIEWSTLAWPLPGLFPAKTITPDLAILYFSPSHSTNIELLKIEVLFTICWPLKKFNILQDWQETCSVDYSI